MSGKSFKVSDSLKFWVLEQKLPTRLKEIFNRDEAHTNKELATMDNDKLISMLTELGAEIPKREKKEGQSKEDEEGLYNLGLIREVLEKEEEACKYRANIWVFEEEMDAIKKFRDLIKDIPDVTDSETIEKIGRTFNLQEQEIIETKMNLRAVSWLKIFLLSSKQT